MFDPIDAAIVHCSVLGARRDFDHAAWLSRRLLLERQPEIARRFEPGHVPGLAFFAMQDELAEILGRPVDLNTPQFLGSYFRDEVIAGAEVLYVRQ